MSEAPVEADELFDLAGFESVAMMGVEFGGLLFGIDVHQVDEVIEVSTVTPLPLAPAHVLGLLNWRGRPVPLVVVERFCGLEVPDLDEASRALVVRSADVVIALRAPSLRGLFEVTPPSHDHEISFGPMLTPYVRGIVDLGRDVLLAFDLDRFVEESRVRS